MLYGNATITAEDDAKDTGDDEEQRTVSGDRDTRQNGKENEDRSSRKQDRAMHDHSQNEPGSVSAL